jgi:hypothetical protein
VCVCVCFSLSSRQPYLFCVICFLYVAQPE